MYDYNTLFDIAYKDFHKLSTTIIANIIERALNHDHRSQIFENFIQCNNIFILIAAIIEIPLILQMNKYFNIKLEFQSETINRVY